MKKIKIKPVFNKRNNQINFSLKKGSFPKNKRKNLTNLKEIELDLENFKFKEDKY